MLPLTAYCTFQDLASKSSVSHDSKEFLLAHVKSVADLHLQLLFDFESTATMALEDQNWSNVLASYVS